MEPTEPLPPAAVAPDAGRTTDQPTDDTVARLTEENRALRLTLDTREVARTRLADPDDLLRYVEPDALLDGQGRPDHGKIAAAAERLLTERPYLAATPRSSGSADGGARFGLSSLPMTREEVAAADPRLVSQLAAAGKLTHLGYGAEGRTA